MDQNELEEPHDDDVVEITNLNQDDEEGSSNTPRYFTQTWLLSPQVPQAEDHCGCHVHGAGASDRLVRSCPR